MPASMRERVFNARTSTFSGDEMKQRTAKRRNSAWSNRFVQRAKQPMAISEDRVAYRPRISFAGQIAYACLPLRQDVVLSNMRRAFSDRLCEAEIRDLAQAFYSHSTPISYVPYGSSSPSPCGLRRHTRKWYGSSTPRSFSRRWKHVAG